VVDVTITLGMMIILFRARSASPFGETRDRLSRLLRLIIPTGFLPSVAAIPITPLLYYAPGGGGYTFTWYFLGKFYVISLLANLNARSYHPISGVANLKENGDLGITSNSIGTTNPLSFIRSIPRIFRRDRTCIQEENPPQLVATGRETVAEVVREQSIAQPPHAEQGVNATVFSESV